MAFHDVRFPLPSGLESGGGPEWRTEVVTLASGHEERNQVWAGSRRRYDAGLGVRSLDDMAAVLAFFEARCGRMHGFRFRDPLDFASAPPSAPVTAADQVLGAGDGARTVFQLVKRYGEAPHETVRPIAKPVPGTVRVALGGVEQAGGWSVDPLTGQVAFAAAPAAGVAVTAGFLFDVPVRFDTDTLTLNRAAFAAGDAPHVPLVEIR